MIHGAVEAGGTKMVCGIGDARAGSRETCRIETRAPDETIAEMVRFFRAGAARHGPLAALGIASFGPLDLDPASPDHGALTTTPKPGWSGANLPRALGEALGVATAIDTDVNAAALAEATLGAARGRQAVAYVTVGTGIGVGLVIAGRTVTGLGHPEAGHLLPRLARGHGDFAGTCPYHGDCLEGLASGPAIQAAFGGSLADLVADHPAWGIVADYLGQLCASLILTVAPEHIVLGGGVMTQRRLFPMVRAQALARLAGYAAAWCAPGIAEARITPPGCAEPPGLIGAYLLAERLEPALTPSSASAPPRPATSSSG